MNKYYVLLLISITGALYGQNPPTKEEIFSQNVQQANIDYETLTADEKEICKWVGKNLAVQCARELKGMELTQLIPSEINYRDSLDVIDQSFAAAKARQYRHLKI